MSLSEGQQRHSDEWALREKLALVSCVRRVGRDSWSAVARMMRNIVEPGRPAHFFSAGRCALKFAELNTSGDSKKRESKKSSRWSTEDLDNSSTRRSITGGSNVNFSASASGMSDEQLLEDRLRVERIEELQTQLDETHRRFSERARLLADLQNGRLDTEAIRRLQREMINTQRDAARQSAIRRSEASQTADSREAPRSDAPIGTETHVPTIERERERERPADSGVVSTYTILGADTVAEQVHRAPPETPSLPSDASDQPETRRNDSEVAAPVESKHVPDTKPVGIKPTVSNVDAGRPDAPVATSPEVAKATSPPVQPDPVTTPKRASDIPAQKSDSSVPRAGATVAQPLAASTSSSPSARASQTAPAPTVTASVTVTSSTVVASPSAVQKTAVTQSTVEHQVAGQTAPLKLTLKLNRSGADVTATPTQTQTQIAPLSSTSTPLATPLEAASPTRPNTTEVTIKTEKPSSAARNDAPSSELNARSTGASTRQSAAKAVPVPSKSSVPDTSIIVAQVPAPGGERDDGWAVETQDPLSMSLGSSAVEREQRARFKKQALEALRAVSSHKHALIFQRPVTAEQAPGYASTVRAPADLNSTRRRVEQAAISSYEQLAATLRRMFINAVMFNRRDDHYFTMAVEMHDDAIARLDQHFPPATTDYSVAPAAVASLHDIASFSSSLLSPSASSSVTDSPASGGALAAKSLRAAAAASKKPLAPPAAIIPPAPPAISPADDAYASYNLLFRRRRTELLAAAATVVTPTTADAPLPRSNERDSVEAQRTLSSLGNAPPNTADSGASRRTRKRVRSRSSTSTTELDTSNGEKPPERDAPSEKPTAAAAATATSTSTKASKQQQQQQQVKATESRAAASNAAKKRRK